MTRITEITKVLNHPNIDTVGRLNFPIPGETFRSPLLNGKTLCSNQLKNETSGRMFFLVLQVDLSAWYPSIHLLVCPVKLRNDPGNGHWNISL